MTNDPENRQEQTGPLVLLRMLRRRLAIVIACTLLIPGAALAYSLVQQKQYSASASLLFRDPQLDQKLFGSTVFSPTIDPTREAATNVKLVSLEVVAARTSRALGGVLGPQAVASKVSVAPAGQSDVANITATDHVPAFAAKLANTFATQFIAFRRDADRSKISSAQQLVDQQVAQLSPAARNSPNGNALRQRSEELRILAALQTGNAELVQPAQAPSSPSSPKPTRNTAIGLVFGILLGIALAALLERVDRRLRDPRDIGDTFERPVLGAIPESRSIARSADGAQVLEAGEAEAFRMLRANLRYFNVDRTVRSVLITSASPGEGKSTVAVHLAAAAASTGDRVLLIEADLRRPSLAGKLGIPMSRGLSQILAGDLTIADAAQTLPIAGGTAPRGESTNGHQTRSIDVIVSGPIPPNPADLIESERMREIITEAEQSYGLVVIDTPPTSVVSDAIPLVKEVSGVIVVTRLGRVTRESASHLRNQLRNLNAYLIGVVVNSVGRTGGYGGYGYGYGYGYGAAEYVSATAASGADASVEAGQAVGTSVVSPDAGQEPARGADLASTSSEASGAVIARAQATGDAAVEEDAAHTTSNGHSSTHHLSVDVQPPAEQRDAPRDEPRGTRSLRRRLRRRLR